MGECIRRNVGTECSGTNNVGKGNAGNWNTGDFNTGDFNSGHKNAGRSNAGCMNSGHWNNGHCNSGDGFKSSFCTESKYFLFNKECTKVEHDKILDKELWRWFRLTEWVDGKLKTYTYKQAWRKCPIDKLDEIKKLANFDKDVFKEITGIEV